MRDGLALAVSPHGVGPFQFSIWDATRDPMLRLMRKEKPFNSLFEMLMARLRSLRSSSPRLFQFSIWDATRKILARIKLENDFLSILYLRCRQDGRGAVCSFRVFQFSIWDAVVALAVGSSTLTYVLSILYLRCRSARRGQRSGRWISSFNSLFEMPIEATFDGRDGRHSDFQFSIWDAASLSPTAAVCRSLSILYLRCPLLPRDEVPRVGPLSILYLRCYPDIDKKKDDYILDFQFSIWDASSSSPS